jgi:hypothetical protein
MSKYEDTLFSIFESLKYSLQAAPMNLGGISDSGGGTGGPAGGFIGVLPQTRVAYDYSEIEADTSAVSILNSGESLLDNLNKIRYRVRTVENLIESGEVGGTITVEDGGVIIDPDVTIIDFQNNLKVNAGDPGTVGVKVVGETTGSLLVVGAEVDEKTLVEDNDNLYYDVENHFLNVNKIQIGRRAYISPVTPANIHVLGEDGALASVVVEAYAGEGVGYPILSLYHARGIADALSPTISGDIIGAIVARGYGTTAYGAGSKARFYFKAYQDWTDTANGCRAEIQLTPNGSDTPVTVVNFYPESILAAKQTKIDCNSTSALVVEQTGVVNNVLVVNTTDGKVGIGTATPRQRLEVVTPGVSLAETAISFENPNTGSWANVVFDFLVAGTTKGSITTFRNGTTSAGLMSFRPANSSGATVRSFDVSPTEVTVNEDGLSTVDLRVESDNYNALFVDASNNSIVIMSNTAGKIGFYGATAVAQQVLATGASHTVDDVITFLQTVGLCKQS